MSAAAVPTPGSRLLAAAGALLAAAAIALSAYAAHGADGEVQSRLQTAALFAFGHGIALAALAPQATRLARFSLAAMLLGVLMFSGSITAKHFLGVPAMLAPHGGSVMILAWLALAVAALRR